MTATFVWSIQNVITAYNLHVKFWVNPHSSDMVLLTTAFIEKECARTQSTKSLTKGVCKNHLRKITHLFMNDKLIEAIVSTHVHGDLNWKTTRSWYRFLREISQDASVYESFTCRTTALKKSKISTLPTTLHIYIFNTTIFPKLRIYMDWEIWRVCI